MTQTVRENVEWILSHIGFGEDPHGVEAVKRLNAIVNAEAWGAPTALDVSDRGKQALILGPEANEVAPAEASLEAENLQLRSALDAMMAAHWNLYLCQFPNGDPNDDLVRVKARAALTRPATSPEETQDGK